ncbi:hypothetical protein [Winogradskyella sp. 3972H.M.0a.05]|uniref:hypothetical protein n=1 Tax=Winogradskyella sp. 3972H.M.0a.05 TaxID=2950277 RepID=UPI00339B4258
MKSILNLIVATTLCFTINSKAQEQVSLSLHQDLKFAIIGDEQGGHSTRIIDITARFKMQGKQQQFGYMVIYPAFQYANLLGIYKRYYANVGYSFNRLFIKNFEAMAGLNYGIQDRFSKSFLTFGADFELSYNISEKFKFSLLAQVVERKDLAVFYDDYKLGFSGSFGLEFNL